MQLALYHGETTVTDKADHRPLALDELGGHRAGQGEAHGREAVGSEHRSRLVRLPSLTDEYLVRADVHGNEGLARKTFARDIDDVGRIELAAHAPLVIGGEQLVAMRANCLLWPLRLAVVAIGQPLQDGADRAHQLDIGRVDLIGVGHGVDMHHWHRQTPGLDQLYGIEADSEDEVGGAEKLPHQRVAGHIDRTRVVRVILRQHAFGLDRYRHGRSAALGKRAQSGARACAQRRHAGHDDRSPRLGKALGGVVRTGRSKHLCPFMMTAHRRQTDLALGRFGGADVDRGRDVHRPRPLGHGNAQGLAHDRAGRLRDHACGPFGDRREQAVVVHILMREDRFQARVHLPGDRQHRRAVEKGTGHAVDQIRRAGAERRHAHPWQAGQLAIGVGHKSRRAFSARQHELHALLARGFHELQIGIAGVAEYIADAGLRQILGHQGRGGQLLGHLGTSPSVNA